MPETEFSPENIVPKEYEPLPTPEIVIQREPGLELLSLLYILARPGWGNTEHPLAKAVHEHRATFQAVTKFSAFLAKYEATVDEETLYNLALTYDDLKRFDAIATELKEHKRHSREALQDICHELIEIIKTCASDLDASPLKSQLEDFRRTDLEKREALREKYTATIRQLNAFFHPDAQTAAVRQLIIVPTDPLLHRYQGRAYSFAENLVIMSNIDNWLNFQHEYLHSVINPIVDKLQMTEAQGQAVIDGTDQALIEDYGQRPRSLLNEQIIRVYTRYFSRGKELPPTLGKISFNLNKLFGDYTREATQSRINFEQYFLARFPSILV